MECASLQISAFTILIAVLSIIQATRCVIDAVFDREAPDDIVADMRQRNRAIQTWKSDDSNFVSSSQAA
jgi:hypothetical protein